MFTDSHCHLYSEFYDNIDEVILSAKNNGVYRYISCADSLNSCKEVHENSYKYDNYYYSLGIHPENYQESYLEFEKIFYYCLPNKKLVAIGEIGLDYHYDNFDKKRQIELFSKQLALAEKESLPVIVHSRDATMDTINILKNYNLKGVIHCFSGSLETAKEYLKMGFYIGIGGVLTFKNSKLKDIIKDIPLDRIILETDSPFLAPEPFRGQINEPKNIKEIAEYLAKVKEISIDEVANQTETNIHDLFNI